MRFVVDMVLLLILRADLGSAFLTFERAMGTLKHLLNSGDLAFSDESRFFLLANL